MENKNNTAFSAMSMYHARKDFLEKTFKIDKFTTFALEHDEEDLIKENIKELSKKIPETELKYRFIEIDNPSDEKTETFLRAVVDSKRYKLYDNNIVLYLALEAIDNYATKKREKFQVASFEVTDSKFNLYIYSKNVMTLKYGVKLSVGIQVSNSELSDGSEGSMKSWTRFSIIP
ncbi:hypothetical protein PESHB5_01840 [Pediococcus parvulus]